MNFPVACSQFRRVCRCDNIPHVRTYVCVKRIINGKTGINASRIWRLYEPQGYQILKTVSTPWLIAVSCRLDCMQGERKRMSVYVWCALYAYNGQEMYLAPS